jgi:hypothetical protein
MMIRGSSENPRHFWLQTRHTVQTIAGQSSTIVAFEKKFVCIFQANLQPDSGNAYSQASVRAYA